MSTIRARLSAKSNQQKSQQRRPNALKHGVFSVMTTLPGEDPAEFTKLHLSLIEEWNPTSQTQAHHVFTIAKGMWYLARVQRFLGARVEACALDPEHKLFFEAHGLNNMYKFLEKHDPTNIDSGKPNRVRLEPDARSQERDEGAYEGEIEKDIELLLQGLSKEDAEHLRERFGKYKFGSNVERVAAIRKEIKEVLLPRSLRFGSPPTNFLLHAATDVLSPDVWDHLLALEERIDASIRRATRELIQLKALEKILDTAPSRMKVVAAPSKS